MDLILRNCLLRANLSLVDIAINNGFIEEITPNLSSKASQEIDLAGAIVLPPFSDPHVHLDAVLTAGTPRHNQSGTLLEGIQIWSERKKELTFSDVYQRAIEAIKWSVAQGTLNIRTHVDTCDESLTALRALLQVKADLKDYVNLQIVAFPQEGVLCYPKGVELLEEALQLGADCVGGIPHFEWTKEDGIKELEIVFQLADKYNRFVDIHCDETDDEESRFLEHVVALAKRHRIGKRVVAGHTTAMHSYNNAYAFKLIRLLAQSEVSIIANPLDNSILQGRFDTYPKRRGLTRVKELLAAGVNVGIGHDSIMDPWYPLGRAQMLQAAFVLLHMCQMSGRDEQSAILDMITFGNARALAIDNYGIAVSRKADLVVLDAYNEFDILRLLPTALYVIKNGQVIAETPKVRAKIYIKNLSGEVNFTFLAEK
ncbi:MAG: cytosine deaminase [Blastocatellia bacterium]